MELYTLLKNDLPFALTLHYNLIYAYSYPESDIALQALGNLSVSLNLLKGFKDQMQNDFDQSSLQEYLKYQIIKEMQRLHYPNRNDLLRLDKKKQQQLIEVKNRVNEEKGIEKYNNVIGCLNQFLAMLDRFEEFKVQEVFGKIKARVEYYNIQDAYSPDHSFDNFEEDEPIEPIQRKIPPLYQIEYEESILNNKELPELKNTRVANPFDPLDNNNIISTDFTSPSLRSFNTLTLFSKSQLSFETLKKAEMGSNKEKIEERYTGFNIEVMLEVMHYCLCASYELMHYLGSRELKASHLEEIRFKRLRLDLIIQRYMRRINPQIRLIISRAWGVIDMQSKMFEYIDEYDLVAEIMGMELQSGQSQEPIEDGFSHNVKGDKQKSDISLPPHKKEKELDSEQEVKYEEVDDNVWDELEKSFMTSRENSFMLLCEKEMEAKTKEKAEEMKQKENEMEPESFVALVTKELERQINEGIELKIEKQPEEERRILTIESFEAPRPQEADTDNILNPKRAQDDFLEAVIAKKRMSQEIDIALVPSLSVIYSVNEKESVEPSHQHEKQNDLLKRDRSITFQEEEVFNTLNLSNETGKLFDELLACLPSWKKKKKKNIK